MPEFTGNETSITAKKQGALPRAFEFFGGC